MMEQAPSASKNMHRISVAFHVFVTGTTLFTKGEHCGL